MGCDLYAVVATAVEVSDSGCPLGLSQRGGAEGGFSKE